MFDDLREQSRAADYVDEIEAEPASTRLADFVNSFSPRQRFVIALMIFANATFWGCLCLMITGRIGV